MKKNLYYRNVLRRTSLLKSFVIRVFVGLASWPRLILEIFIRKNFGERYFSFSVAILVGVILLLLPVLFQYGGNLLLRGSGGGFLTFALGYTSWYLFTAGFLYMAYLRKMEIKRNPSVYDFEKYSLYSGDINPFFYTINFRDWKTSVRRVECLIEPGVFFLAGILLAVFGQSIGTLIIICSIIYSLSYLGSYYLGDDFVMDKIDEMICNEEMLGAFVEDKDASETRGVRFYGRKPADENVRQKVVESFTEEEPVFEAR